MSQQPGTPPRKSNHTRLNSTAAAAGPVQQPASAPPPSMELLAAEFEALLASNTAKFQELAASGTQPDPLYLVHRRINHLIDMIASATGPNGPRWAMMTRLEFERQVAAELDQAGPALRLMQLAEGARYTPAMIAELARTAKVFRPA